jgi:hypothetical protein
MRVLAACGLSLMLYLLVFGFCVDRPLSLGVLRLEIDQKTLALAALPSPKLVILAGSNGPYSHSCAVMGEMLNLPCENAGIAVGIGLDALFARDAPLLRRGDVLYMPMELQQYVTTRRQVRAGVDGGIWFRHDRRMLAQLPLDRVLGAMFCCNLPDLLEGLAELPMADAGAIQPGQVLAGEYNAQGDRIDNVLAAADPALLDRPARPAPDAVQITRGYGAALIGRFVAQERARGVVVIGGLPTDFATVPLPAGVLRAVANIYLENGGVFMALPNESHYPAADFFNSEDHLAQPCQFLHSIAVAQRLAILLHRPLRPSVAAVMQLAATCPGQGQAVYAISAAR